MVGLSATIRVSGFSELSGALKSGRLDEAINAGISEAANEMESTSTGLCPVDTGALAGSISIIASGSSIHGEASEDYASYVDEGTSRMDAQPFFTEPITDIVENQLPDILGRNIEAYLSTI